MTAIETRIKRAIYRANYRGTKELDLILGRFARSELAAMSEDELKSFELLLALPDPEIDKWIKGGQTPADITGIIAKIRDFHSIESD